MDDEGRVAVLGSRTSGSGGMLVRLEEGKQVAKFELDEEAERVIWDSSIKWAVLDREGSLLQCKFAHILPCTVKSSYYSAESRDNSQSLSPASDNSNFT